MKLYELTITATVTDLEKLSVQLSADVVLDSPQLRGAAMQVMPHHLRKIADDMEQGRTVQ